MKEHIVDRFLWAMHPHWPEIEGEPTRGVFRASPEVAQMLTKHAQRFGFKSGTMMFGNAVIPDATIERGTVVFVPEPKR